MNKISKDDWQQVHTQIVLLRYFIDLYQNHQPLLKKADKHLARFSRIIKADVGISIKNGQNLTPNVYAILVRTHELFAKLNDDAEFAKQIYEVFLNEIGGLEKLEQKYKIVFETLPSRDNEHDTFYQIIRGIRNSIAHFNYKFNSNNIILKSIDPDGSTHMECELPMFQLLNLTFDLGNHTNDYLVKKDYLE